MSYFSPILESGFYNDTDRFINSILEAVEPHEDDIEMIEEVAFDIKTAADAKEFRRTIDNLIEDVKRDTGEAATKKRKIVTMVSVGVALLSGGAAIALPAGIMTAVAAGVAAACSFIAVALIHTSSAIKNLGPNITKIINNIDDTIEEKKLPSGAISDLKKAKSSLEKVRKELKQ